MGDRIVVMRGGLVQQIGDPETIYHQPANLFVARFIGNPPMNQFDGKLENSGEGLQLHTSFGTLALPATVRERLQRRAVGVGSQPVVCGIRAEDIAVNLGSSPLPNQINGVIDLVEPLGSDVFASVAVGKDMLLARTRPDAGLQEGQSIGISLDPAKIHLFAPEGGENLVVGY